MIDMFVAMIECPLCIALNYSSTKHTHDDRSRSILCKCAHVSIASICARKHLCLCLDLFPFSRVQNVAFIRFFGRSWRDTDNSKDFIYLEFLIGILGKAHQLPNFECVQSLARRTNTIASFTRQFCHCLIRFFLSFEITKKTWALTIPKWHQRTFTQTLLFSTTTNFFLSATN